VDNFLFKGVSERRAVASTKTSVFTKLVVHGAPLIYAYFDIFKCRESLVQRGVGGIEYTVDHTCRRNAIAARRCMLAPCQNSFVCLLLMLQE
jgi:hypothetical protein